MMTVTPLTVSSLPTCAVIEEIETFIFIKRNYLIAEKMILIHICTRIIRI